MTLEKQLEQTVVLDETSDIIYRAYLPFFRENVSSLKTDDYGRKYRVVEGAIIVDRRAVQKEMGWTDQEASDHFTTLWDVDGFLTDVRKINFDFRHNGISTGAVGERSWKVDDYEIQIDDKILKVPARMLAVRVYEDSQIRIKGKNGETLNDGGLLENIENGRVFTWSVEFKPVTQLTTRTGLPIFKTYHTPRISFLDVTQGIPDAGGFTIRNFLGDEIINNQNNMQTKNTTTPEVANTINLEVTHSALEAETVTLEELSTLTENRDITVELEDEVVVPDEGETIVEEPTPEADTNQDGEISDEEARAYIKNIKRAFGDNPSMINDKMAELERMCGDMVKRMDDMVAAGSTQRQLDEDEIEAQRIRALNENLSTIPEKKPEEAGDGQRLLGNEGEIEGKEEGLNNVIKAYQKALGYKL